MSITWNAINDFSHTNPRSAPNVIYYVVNGNITGGNESDRVELDTSDFTLTIPEVRESDERRYFCLVQTTLAGGFDDSGTSRVSSKYLIKNSPIKINVIMLTNTIIPLLKLYFIFIIFI